MAVGMNDLFEYAVIWMDLPKITFKYNKKQKKKKIPISRNHKNRQK